VAAWSKARLVGLLAVALLAGMGSAQQVKRGSLIPGAGKAVGQERGHAGRVTLPKAGRKAPPPQTGKSAEPGRGPRAPYRGAIAVDAASGRVLFADKETNLAYPASVTKLMTFLLVLEDVQRGAYKLTDRATASRYATTMEPSSVGIKPGESMTIEDLLYSIMVKSANDAAMVLAENAAWHRGGAQGPFPVEAKDHAWCDAFVARMNRRAHELGMKDTRYASPNGLPPGTREKRGFDTSTASDIAKLCRAVVKIPGALKYTSCTKRMVVDGSGQKAGLSTHNYFLPGSFDKDGCARPVEGCDGLKTGYTMASGSSIALTASRYGRRVVVVVLGSAGRHEREAAAGRILRDALDAVSLW